MRRRQAEALDQARGARGDLSSLRKTLGAGGEKEVARAAERVAIRRGRGVRRAESVTRRAATDRLSAALVDDLEQKIRGLEGAIAKSRLQASVGGIVVVIHLAEGATWNTRSSDPVLEVLEPSSLSVRAMVPEDVAGRLLPGQAARLEFRGGRSIDTRLERVSSAVLLLPGESGSDEAVREASFALPEGRASQLEPGDPVRVLLSL